MSTQSAVCERPGHGPALAEDYLRTRAETEALCAPLVVEDYVVQSMPDVSPIKWHLAHTTWFFETFILVPHAPGYQRYRPEYAHLFNSYYQGVGPVPRRSDRGLQSRPTVQEVYEYRRMIDERIRPLLEQAPSSQVAALVKLGLEHENQHRELILTDLKHILHANVVRPAYKTGGSGNQSPSVPLHFQPYPGGIREIGARGAAFCFDNETPRHRIFLAPWQLANRVINNGEYRDFIRDGSYQRPSLWLADGWAAVQSRPWAHPLYWNPDLESTFTLLGVQALEPQDPVAHVSLYEADAFARWAGARLPTEAEWEIAAEGLPVAGNFVEAQQYRPLAPDANHSGQPLQMFGDVWEWTQSAYSPYPGFKAMAGMVGEYNGKFMASQFVLRGGSCASPAAHVRASYRNFFYPDARWQFSGIRLARDG
jgi:ergothioneine biosynthesis protein EgtB